jgi:hypothetical protein
MPKTERNSVRHKLCAELLSAWRPWLLLLLRCTTHATCAGKAVHFAETTGDLVASHMRHHADHDWLERNTFRWMD